MKNIMLAVLLTISLCASAQVKEDEINFNPLDVARAFALKSPTHFQCSISGRTYVSNNFTWVDMRFIMRKSDFGITNLVINDVPILLKEPLYSLPLGEAGFMQDVYVYVDALASNRDYAGHGNLHLEIIDKDAVINVMLRPGDVREEIAIDLTVVDKYDIDVKIDNFIYGFGYGWEGDKFYIYFPPVGGKYTYTLRRRSDGSIIGRGVLEPFKNAATLGDTYFGISYAGNVMSAEFPQSGEAWIGRPIRRFDCQVPFADGTRAGKVFFTDVGTGGLEILIGIDAWVYVQKATEHGDMPVMTLVDRSISWDNGRKTTRVYTAEKNVGRVVVTIIPKGELEDNQWFNLHRFYGLPASEDDGGKG